VRFRKAVLATTLAGACALGLTAVCAGGGRGTTVASRSGGAADKTGTALAALQRPLAAAPGDPLFMSVTGIPGGSTDPLHPNWIDITGYSDSFSNSELTLGQGGPPKFGSLVVTMPDSVAVPALLRALDTASNLPTVELQGSSTPTAGTERNYLTIQLTNARVTGLDETSTGGQPAEMLTMTAQKVSVNYTNLANGSQATTCWDYALNLAC
jgi:type VI protein secretion system component Hcp